MTGRIRLSVWLPGMAALIVYVAIAGIRELFLFGTISWVIGEVWWTVIAALTIGFLANDYGLALRIAIVSALFEALLVFSDHRLWAPWIGGLLPCGVILYFGHRLIANLGD